MACLQMMSKTLHVNKLMKVVNLARLSYTDASFKKDELNGKLQLENENTVEIGIFVHLIALPKRQNNPIDKKTRRQINPIIF